MASQGLIGRDGAVFAHVLDSMFYSMGTMVLWHLSSAVGGIVQVLLKLLVAQYILLLVKMLIKSLDRQEPWTWANGG